MMLPKIISHTNIIDVHFGYDVDDARLTYVNDSSIVASVPTYK